MSGSPGKSQAYDVLGSSLIVYISKRRDRSNSDKPPNYDLSTLYDSCKNAICQNNLKTFPNDPRVIPNLKYQVEGFLKQWGYKVTRQSGLQGLPGQLGMTSKGDGALSPPTLPVESQEATLNVLKRRQLDNIGFHSTSDPSLQQKNLNSISGNSQGPAASLPTSRSASPSNQSTRSGIWRNGISFTGSSTVASSIADQHLSEDTRDTIFRSFAPHIAVYASEDTEELVKGKGIPGGLLSLLRPFGETVQGKVTTRDSIGASKSWEDFGVHFVGLGEGLPRPRTSIQADNHKRETGFSPLNQKQRPYAGRTGGNIDEVEALVREHLSNAESDDDMEPEGSAGALGNTTEGVRTSPYFALYLRRMLSGIPISPHEAFSHPVGCVLAISSRNKAPIETLRQLYDNTTHGDKRLPIWVNNDYLRYYVLIHDEENHDISKSSILFEQMKRHFGLNCHLLRLRTTRSIPSDDDVTPLPDCEWMSAAEELQKNYDQDHSDNPEDLTTYIQESDAHAVRTFIREMVTQSIVPFMERWVVTWNDQVASRRRGLSGRFMSLSKKWTGFSASSRSASGSYAGSGSGSSSSNYDTLQGFYRPDSPEATMRKLADFAFMLRDFKLAQGVYELLKTDFSNDKAWKYHAGAHEMAALSTLLIPYTANSRVPLETVDALLETAYYSYYTRCGSLYETLRCLLLAMELFKSIGRGGLEHAARWATRVLDANLTGQIGRALVMERITACFASNYLSLSGVWKYRRRKASFWSVLAAETWYDLQIQREAKKCLDLASENLKGLPPSDTNTIFEEANGFTDNLQRTLLLSINSRQKEEGGGNITAAEQDDLMIDEEHEKLDHRPHRHSLIGVNGPPSLGFQGGQLGATKEIPIERDKGFE